MRTGICTTDFESNVRPADELFGKISDMGFECLQFAFSSVSECDFRPTGQLEIPEIIHVSAVNAIDRAAARYSLPIVAVNGTFNMAHPDKSVRKEGLKRFENLAAASSELGAKYITLCSGTRCAEHLWTYSDLNDNSDAWDDMLDTVCRAAYTAMSHGITVAIESEISNIIDTPENARKIMDILGEPVKMILDCANLFAPGKAKKENVREIIGHAIDVFGNDIVIAHGKDIREGDGISFCGTGLGIVDFTYTAKRLHDIDFGGDMFLHGIYDENDMPRALDYWKKSEKESYFKE